MIQLKAFASCWEGDGYVVSIVNRTTGNAVPSGGTMRKEEAEQVARTLNCYLKDIGLALGVDVEVPE